MQYVCQPDGRGEMYEIKETSSCEYEVVVLTSLLCSHPAYGYVLVCFYCVVIICQSTAAALFGLKYRFKAKQRCCS